jgi:hypothetical protein
LKHALRWGVLAAVLFACNGSTVDRTLVNGKSGGGPDAGIANDAANVSGSDGSAAEAATGLNGTVCAQVTPTTASGTCPVMPARGEICTPPRAPDCGSRASCAYPTTTGASAQYCRPVCADQSGVCPPAPTACITLGSCQTAADCKGDLPQDCRVCPLSPDGVETTACAHWVCDVGICAVGYCENHSSLTCPGGHGCPAYTYPALDQACTQDTDCVLESHIVNCCQSKLVGIATSEKAHFESIESTCRATLDPFFTQCGCVGTAVDEDGNFAQVGQQIVAACEAGRCKSVVRGRISCGSSSCPEGQSCCTAPDATGLCVYTCAPSCPPSNAACRI